MFILFKIPSKVAWVQALLDQPNSSRFKVQERFRPGVSSELMLLLLLAVGILYPATVRAVPAQLAAGSSHTMALLEDGTIRAWGSPTQFPQGIPVTGRSGNVVKSISDLLHGSFTLPVIAGSRGLENRRSPGTVAEPRASSDILHPRLL